MMKDKKITWKKQKEITKAMRVGQALPVEPERGNQPYDISELSTQESPSKSFNMTSRSIINKESREDIEKRGGYERPQYRGGVCVNRDHLKDQFVNKLAFGMEDPVREYRKMKAKELQAPKKEAADRFTELENEIKEREEFLKSMEKLGQGQKYEAGIKSEISSIIREMEKIDLERNEELERKRAQIQSKNSSITN
ncbi:Oidioi.mRNA.OKI2018_I69.chr1.g1436.t1.cds [Oikopleura dioica]|uniref:Oidioi.mRNA.OKI2018_I69.chr1.g1436.t1.cds n=1 Tax=Oikopleura dioica TaxID=34765 RepID=A0ABN7SS54_OIKDI|nr:Oidioi.mRNA.OKI2018_I69.chr1.g1436.t1.cds [Oikopleura dioica]